MVSPAHSPASRPAVSVPMRVLAWVMLIAPAVGTAVNVVLLAGASEAWARTYRESHVLAAGMLLAVAVLFGSHFHYRRTRMRIDIVSRIAANLWLFSSVWLYWSLVRPN